MALRLGHDPFAETADPAVVSGAVVVPIAGSSSYALSWKYSPGRLIFRWAGFGS